MERKKGGRNESMEWLEPEDSVELMDHGMKGVG